MNSAPTVKTTNEVAVGMGQAMFAREPVRLTTILGSCVAVTLYSPHRRLGMLGHIVLPHSKGSASNPAKFADTAVPYMLATLKSHGVEARELTAKLAGGACMFGTGLCMQIGESNVQATVEALESAGIRIAARDVCGSNGRRISFDLATGSIVVTSVGRPSQTI
jgi:chemotaxis protein CheD